MGYINQNDIAILGGGLGNAGAWDIISATAHDLEGKTVIAFASTDVAGGTFSEMEEETIKGKPGKAGTSTAVAAKYLTYTYPQYQVFPGRYTKLTPAAGCSFQVWFLK
jgi:hypothetical protein